MYRIKSAVVNDQFFFGEELERAVSLHIDAYRTLPSTV
jgi:hypothetical protein